MSNKPKEIPALPQANSSTIVAMDPLVAMIERASRDPAIDLDRLERLITMQTQAEMTKAKAAFNDAMAAAQQDMTPIARDSNNPQTRSRYASYFAIDKAIRHIYGSRGIRVSFDEGEPVGDYIRVVAIVTKGQHEERYHYDSPIITKGMKGNEMMTLTHARASAVTYAKRYLVGMIFNLSTGEDTDGNAPLSGEVVSDDQLLDLQKLATDVKANIEVLCQLLKVPSLSDLPSRQFDSAMALLKAKRDAMKKSTKGEVQ